MLKSDAYWSITLDVVCPHCKADIDLIDDDSVEKEDLPQPGQYIPDLNLEVECPKCNSTFLVHNTFY
ncbi:MAG: hypothetical protein BGO59_25960 [Spirosoma sp. 48-14]|nr:MAG: hypothetical protein BGO59_25960 [Spirosoma sp. 48-14]